MRRSGRVPELGSLAAFVFDTTGVGTAFAPLAARFAVATVVLVVVDVVLVVGATEVVVVAPDAGGVAGAGAAGPEMLNATTACAVPEIEPTA